MKKQNRFPPGAVAEDEAAYRSTTATVMKIPVKLVPAVRALLAKRRAS